MFSFSRDQEVYDIAGQKVGGQPGEYPTLMIGSIFYDGHDLVEDDEKGIFDEEEAGEQIRRVEELSESTGNPAMLDVVGGSSESLINYIDFAADATDLPFLIDGTTADIRVQATKHVEEVGLADRAVYNTITVDCKGEEIEAIKELGIESAVLLCYNPKRPTIGGRMESLEEVLNIAEEAGVEKKLVDPSVLDLPDPGPAAKAIFKIKDKHGLPAGCGAHNAVDQWKDRRGMDSESYNLRTAIASSFPIVLGADFTLYGPIESAKKMYDACSLTDAYVSYSMRMDEGIGPKVDNSPINRIFRP